MAIWGLGKTRSSEDILLKENPTRNVASATRSLNPDSHATNNTVPTRFNQFFTTIAKDIQGSIPTLSVTENTFVK